MRIFIAGSTGVLGRRLVRDLTAAGHRVTGLTRDDAGDETVRNAGGRPVRGDVLEGPDGLTEAGAGAEVFVHAATKIPTDGRSRKAWEENDRIRREGTRNLVEAAARAGAGLYLQQSLVWVVRPRGGEPYDESTPPDPSPITRSAVDGEEIAREAGEAHGFEVGVLRCGSFYAPDAAHTRYMGRELLKRRLPVVGRGHDLFAPLHADDAAGAFRAAIEAGRSGLWHVVDDRPLPVREYLHTFARKLGAPRPFRVPVWLARLLAGEAAVDVFTTSMNTTNAKARKELGWEPAYPTVDEGLEMVVDAWREEGFPDGA